MLHRSTCLVGTSRQVFCAALWYLFSASEEVYCTALWYLFGSAGRYFMLYSCNAGMSEDTNNQTPNGCLTNFTTRQKQSITTGTGVNS